MKKLWLVILLFLTAPAFAAHQYLEKEYQAVWCERAGGVAEYRLDDGTRVDCLTAEYAVEFDFGEKWAEGCGQALYYAIKTDRKPGVVLILEKPSEEQKYLTRLMVIAKKYGIRVWTTDRRDIEKK